MVPFKISGLRIEGLKLFKSRLLRSLLACGVFCVTASGLCAQAPFSSDVASPAGNVQGNGIELPEDFLSRLDGKKLRVTLESLDTIYSKMSPANLLVHLLDSKGVEKTAISDQQGIAEFSDVQENELYTVVVSDGNAHGAISMMTVSEEKATEKNISSTSIRLPLIGVNKEEILAAINSNIPPKKIVVGSLYGLDDYQLQNLNLHQVRLQSDGTLLGKVVFADRDLPEMLRYAKLTFIRNNEVVARADSNNKDGGFIVDGLSAGIYGIIAAGPAGYSAFAFNVLPSTGEPGLPGANVLSKPVSFSQAEPAKKLYVFLVPPAVLEQVTGQVRETYSRPSDEPIVDNSLGTQPSVAGYGNLGGGFGGGSYGGSGSGSGGGAGGGGFAGIAALGGIGAVLANDFGDSANNNVVSPITPR